MKCKRCGTAIEPFNHLCQGCGKSIAALREENEIIYDEQELSQVEIDLLKGNQEAPKPEIVEEHTNLDVFGDALFGETPKIEPLSNNLGDIPVSPVKEEIVPNPQFGIEEESENIDEVINASKLTSTNSPLDFSPNIEKTPDNDFLRIDNLQTVSSETINQVQNSESLANNDLEINEISAEKLEPTINPQEEKPLAVNEENDIVPTEIKEPKRKKKSKLAIFFIVIALILLAGAGVVFYFYTKTAPSKIFTNSVDEFTVGNSVSNNAKLEMSFGMNISYMTSDESLNQILDIFNNLKIDISSHFTEEKSYLTLKPTYNNSPVIDATIYVQGDETLLYLDGYDRYIDISEEMSSSEIELNNDTMILDMETLTTEMKKELKKVFKSQFLNRSIEKVNINGEDKFVAKSTFFIDSSNYEEFLNNLKANSELTRILASLLSISESEVAFVLEAVFEEIERFEVILYSEILNNEVLKYDISMKTVDQETAVKLEIVKNNDTYNFTLNGVSEEAKLTGSLTITTEGNQKSYTLNLNSDALTMTFDIAYRLEEAVQIEWPDISNKVLFSELTEEEQVELFNVIMSNEAATDFITKIITLMPTSELPDQELINDENIIE